MMFWWRPLPIFEGIVSFWDDFFLSFKLIDIWFSDASDELLICQSRSKNSISFRLLYCFFNDFAWSFTCRCGWSYLNSEQRKARSSNFLFLGTRYDLALYSRCLYFLGCSFWLMIVLVTSCNSGLNIKRKVFLSLFAIVPDFQFLFAKIKILSLCNFTAMLFKKR